jgi:hypothetical protein
MKTYTVREYRNGRVSNTFKPYKQLKRAQELAERLLNNSLIEKSDILVREYGEYERAGDYSEQVIAIARPAS